MTKILILILEISHESTFGQQTDRANGCIYIIWATSRHLLESENHDGYWRQELYALDGSLSFHLFKFSSEANHPVGSTIIYFCSHFSKTTPSLPEALAQLLFFLPVSPLSGCGTTLLKYPSGKHPGLGYFKDSQDGLGPELGQPQRPPGKPQQILETNGSKRRKGKRGPATAGAGQVKSDGAKCTDESLSELSLARRGGGSRWYARTFLLGSPFPLPHSLPAPSDSLPQRQMCFCFGQLWAEMVAGESSCWVSLGLLQYANLKVHVIIPYFTTFRDVVLFEMIVWRPDSLGTVSSLVERVFAIGFLQASSF